MIFPARSPCRFKQQSAEQAERLFAARSARFVRLVEPNWRLISRNGCLTLAGAGVSLSRSCVSSRAAGCACVLVPGRSRHMVRVASTMVHWRKD